MPALQKLERQYFYGGPFGPLAMIAGELGQARKGAAVASDSCAGMWLIGPPPKSS